MTHKRLDELAKMLEEARRKVTVGGRYVHYKHSYYVVKDVVIWEATDEPAIIYQAEYDPRLIFARPLDSWLGTVEVEGKTMRRFAKVSDK